MTPVALINLLRIRQWTKNVFVLFPLIFSGLFLSPDSVTAYWLTGWALFAFCCWSSAIYVFNDILDRNSDRLHPKKQNRPIAAGTISVRSAIVIAIILVILPAVLLRLPDRISVWFWIVGGSYLLNNLLYCLLFRSIPVLDILSLGLGIVLRILGGCAILNVQPTVWIIACGAGIALFLGFGKRRMELDRVQMPPKENDSGDSGKPVACYRATLAYYSPKTLNWILYCMAGITIVAYTCYTTSPSTMLLHKTRGLVFTIPFVIFGIIRYISLCKSGKYDGPDEAIIKDPLSWINIILWIIAVITLFTQF